MSDLVFGIAFAIFAVVTLVRVYRRAPASASKAANWPETQGTIQSVNRMVVRAGRSTTIVDVADFSYRVNGEYYSGRLRVSGCTDGDPSTRELVDQKVRVLYDPKTPDEFSFPQQSIGGFVVESYVGLDGDDESPTSLNIA